MNSPHHLHGLAGSAAGQHDHSHLIHSILHDFVEVVDPSQCEAFRGLTWRVEFNKKGRKNKENRSPTPQRRNFFRVGKIFSRSFSSSQSKSGVKPRVLSQDLRQTGDFQVINPLIVNRPPAAKRGGGHAHLLIKSVWPCTVTKLPSFQKFQYSRSRRDRTTVDAIRPESEYTIIDDFVYGHGVGGRPVRSWWVGQLCLLRL